MRVPAVAVLLLAATVRAQIVGNDPVPPVAPPVADDPYHLPDFKADFPATLIWPTRSDGAAYDRGRRQALARVVANLQGNVRQEVWLMATEFFARAPKDAVTPLIEAMDRAMTDPGLVDMVKNCVEAMGLVGDERFDDALRRALEFPNEAVRQAVYFALASSGKATTVQDTGRYFLHMDGRSRAAWLRAARLRLGDGAVPFFRKFMVSTTPLPIRDAVLKETLELPPAQALEVLRPMWPEAVGDFKVIIAGVMHAAGDTIGTVFLRDLLHGEDPAKIAVAVRCAGRIDPGVLREDILRLSTHGRSEVRQAVATIAARLPGADATAVLETLSEPNEVWDVKVLALRELVKRGKTEAVTVLLEELPTLTGSRLLNTLNLLAASGDARAVPLFLERFRKAPAGEGRQFLQAMAFSGSPAAFDALAQLFLGPEVAVNAPDKEKRVLTTLNYIPLLMLNVRGAEAAMVDFYAKIPKDDHQRRSRFLDTLAGVAADRTDPALRTRIYDVLRGVMFDRTALGQLRVQALNQLTRKALTLDDAMRLSEALPDEAPPMRAVFNDFLREFF